MSLFLQLQSDCHLQYILEAGQDCCVHYDSNFVWLQVCMLGQSQVHVPRHWGALRPAVMQVASKQSKLC